MITQDVTYRIRVKISHADVDNEKDHFINISQYSDSSEAIRKQWVEKLTHLIWGSQNTSISSLDVIRPWDLFLGTDGSVESLPISQEKIQGKKISGMYPARYRIPPSSIEGLER